MKQLLFLSANAFLIVLGCQSQPDNNYIFKVAKSYINKGKPGQAKPLLLKLYAADTALKLLSKGIAIDSTDIDLYARRAAINYTISDFKKALSDNLIISEIFH
jgi:hypothetical protein